MINTIGVTIIVMAGVLFVIFHKAFGRRTAEFYYKLSHVHFSEKGYQIGFLLIGLVFIVFGLLSLLQVIKFK